MGAYCERHGLELTNFWSKKSGGVAHGCRACDMDLEKFELTLEDPTGYRTTVFVFAKTEMTAKMEGKKQLRRMGSRDEVIEARRVAR